MLKKLIYFALACGMLAGCNKEFPGQAGDDKPEPGQLCKMELRCRLEPLSHVETKVAVSADDKVYKLDILEYDSNYNFVAVHTFEEAEGIDLENFVFRDWKTYGVNRYYFLLGNVDADTITYLTTLSTNYLSSNPVPLSAGNWQSGHIPMGGWTYFYYGSTTTPPDAILYRYMFRIDIGTVTADFDDTDLMAEDVRLKSVSIINGNQFFLLANRTYGYNYSFGTNPLGYSVSDITYLNAFGGVTSGYAGINSFYGGNYENSELDMEARGGTGKLAATFRYLYNYNKQKGKHVLNITAPASIRDMCYYGIPSGNGTLCPTGTHVYSLNRSLYGVPRYHDPSSSYYYDATVIENYEYQRDYMKLVLEVEIGDETLFYPILLRAMQPNTLYTIHNITLKGRGSEYSNFYERWYAGSVAIPTVLEWQNAEIDNIDVGYSDSDGTSIY